MIGADFNLAKKGEDLMQKTKLFLDMDNVLVDTLPVLNELAKRDDKVKHPDQVPGVFKDLPPIPGAINGVNLLKDRYDLYILSTAPWLNASAWQDKLLWLQTYFGQSKTDPFYKKVVLTHDKGLVHFGGGILLDDRPYHGASAWLDSKANSTWLQYGYDEELTWSNQLVPFLLTLADVLNSHQGDLTKALPEANQDNFILHGDRTNFTSMAWEN